jgi:hypothetical protein
MHSEPLFRRVCVQPSIEAPLRAVWSYSAGIPASVRTLIRTHVHANPNGPESTRRNGPIVAFRFA